LLFFSGIGVLKIDPGKVEAIKNKPIQRSCKEVFPKFCGAGSPTDRQNDQEGHGSYEATEGSVHDNGSVTDSRRYIFSNAMLRKKRRKVKAQHFSS